jgi:hypothetical protein
VFLQLQLRQDLITIDSGEHAGDPVPAIRLGLADGITFPRVLSIEAVGEIVACPGGEFPVATRVAAASAGAGRRPDRMNPITPSRRHGGSSPFPRAARSSTPEAPNAISMALGVRVPDRTKAVAICVTAR